MSLQQSPTYKRMLLVALEGLTEQLSYYALIQYHNNSSAKRAAGSPHKFLAQVLLVEWRLLLQLPPCLTPFHLSRGRLRCEQLLLLAFQA